MFFIKFLCLVMVLSSGISVSASASLYLGHGSENLEETYSDFTTAVHKASFPHDLNDHSKHQHDDSDENTTDHDIADHASHGQNSATMQALLSVVSDISIKGSIPFGRANFLANPSYAIEHIPD